ncbi:hypothetical protein BC827DRAFT_1271975 [Russula dissimulans]|nr:hypothetical protein BC827DRAFT_1271975 [Russula dissimulans]
MVRRRSSKSKDSRTGPRPLDRRDAKIKRWNTLADIPMDDEDQFHASKDRILLESEEAGADEDGDEDEVFALKGIPLRRQPTVRASKGSKAKAKPLPEANDEEEQESEEEESWGRKKSAYYASNAPEIDSEDEEANEMEEQEARRIQAKARDALLDDDFGLVDIDQGDAEETEDPLLEPVIVAAGQPTPLDKKATLRHIEKTNPETLALAYDWEDIAPRLSDLQDSSTEPDSQALGMVHLHNQTLLTYATTLAFYLYLRASEYFSQRPELLRSHPIFARLLQLKQALTTLEELDFDLSDSDSGIGDSEEDDDSLDQAETEDVLLKRTRKGSRLGLDDLAELLREAEEAVTSVKTITKSKPAVLLQPKRNPQKEQPIYVPSKLRTAITAPISGDDDALGDAVVLDTADAADKKARKHTLRFHTSKIESASARRQVARLALRGDDDVPYRERRKEKEARVQREALAGRRGQGGDDLDDIEPESIRGATSGAGRQKRERKESKKLAYEAGKAASRATLADTGDLEESGLTPRRSKSVRNPRVKKRQRFAKAKKVIASQKPVFKPGAGDSTWYGGERSGISTVVKSVRF